MGYEIKYGERTLVYRGECNNEKLEKFANDLYDASLNCEETIFAKSDIGYYTVSVEYLRDYGESVLNSYLYVPYYDPDNPYHNQKHVIGNSSVVTKIHFYFSINPRFEQKVRMVVVLNKSINDEGGVKESLENIGFNSISSMPGHGYAYEKIIKADLEHKTFKFYKEYIKRLSAILLEYIEPIQINKAAEISRKYSFKSY